MSDSRNAVVKNTTASKRDRARESTKLLFSKAAHFWISLNQKSYLSSLHPLGADSNTALKLAFVIIATANNYHISKFLNETII